MPLKCAGTRERERERERKKQFTSALTWYAHIITNEWYVHLVSCGVFGPVDYKSYQGISLSCSAHKSGEFL